MASMLLIVAMKYLITFGLAWVLAFICYGEKHGQRAVGNTDTHGTTDTRTGRFMAFAERSAVEWQVSFLLLIINSSVNMLIYGFKDEQFRRVASHITGLDSACKKQVRLLSNVTDLTSKESETLERLSK